MNRYLITLTYLVWMQCAFPDSVSQNVGSTLFVVQNIVHKICLVTGIGCVVAGFIQYKMHRDNPCNVKFSVPVWFWVIGLSLIGLVYLPSPISNPVP